MTRILIIEDDPGMAKGLAYNLEAEGYDVEHAADGAAGLAAARNGGHDLVLLDWMLPKKSGIDVLKRLRADGNETPVILLTARAEEMHKVAGFKLGADDYVTKPFGLGELLARIRARLKAAPAGVVVDFASLQVRRGASAARITPTEAELLRYLLRRADEAVPREEILKDIWGVAHAAETRTLDNHVARLRKKLEADPAHPRALLTVAGVGYRLVKGTIAIQDRDGAADGPVVS